LHLVAARLDQAPDAGAPIDANGNLTSDGTRTFEWDARNQLFAVNSGTHRSEFCYDGLQRRVGIVETESGVTQSEAKVVWCDDTICEERRSSTCGGRSMDLAPDFDEFIGSLTAHGVEFVVVGAYALALHGAPRFTGDLDILVRPTLDNAIRLLTALEAFGVPVTEQNPETIVDRRRMLQMGVPPVQIHVMSALSGVEWDVCGRIASRGLLAIAACRSSAAKRSSATSARPGRPRDLADIDALEPGRDR
jgi:YD repeat-containing protein